MDRDMREEIKRAKDLITRASNILRVIRNKTSRKNILLRNAFLTLIGTLDLTAKALMAWDAPTKEVGSLLYNSQTSEDDI
jgi:hypothetical protein